MIINYYKSESINKPKLIDSTTSSNYVYIRKNIVEETRDSLGDTYTIYSYDEAKLSTSEYKQYLQEINAESVMTKIEKLTNAILEMSEEVYK